jgi:cell division septum initiation protein DivIVA
MKKRVIVSTILASLLFGTSAVYAKTDNANSITKQQAQFKTTADTQRLHKIVNFEAQKHRTGLKKAPKEVMQGLQQTIVALRALQQNKVAPAKKALSQATFLFDTALKSNPKLGLIPVADSIAVNDFTGDSKLVKQIIDETVTLLKDNDTQAARDMLLPLQDEMTMTTELLPMKMYPNATKQALKLLNKGNSKEAFSTLTAALNSFVVNVTIVPLPLITAQDLVLSASKVAKTNKKEANRLLSLAQDELKKAVLLGYTKKHAAAYKSLAKEISAIQKEVGGGSKLDKMYEHIKKSFHSLITKHESESTKKQSAK